MLLNRARSGGSAVALRLLFSCLVTGFCSNAQASEPAVPPTLLDLSFSGGRPVIKGEKAPPAAARLGGEAARKRMEAARKAKEAERRAKEAQRKAKDAAKTLAASAAKKAATEARKSAAEKKRRLAAQRAAEAARASRGEAARLRAEQSMLADRSLLVLLDGGWVTVPRAFIDALNDREMHPDLVGMGFDISFLRPATARHYYGGRVGLAIPLVPSANWYSADGQPSPRYTEINAVLIDLAFEYVYRRKLFGPVGTMFRGGLGMGIIAGDVNRTETLPVCPDDNMETCPHWRKVGQQDAPLPSRIWPSVHVSLGLTVALGSSFGLHVEGGLRDAPYLGGGLSFGL